MIEIIINIETSRTLKKIRSNQLKFLMRDIRVNIQPVELKRWLCENFCFFGFFFYDFKKIFLTHRRRE